jgi:hypothetical protein
VKLTIISDGFLEVKRQKHLQYVQKKNPAAESDDMSVTIVIGVATG